VRGGKMVEKTPPYFLPLATFGLGAMLAKFIFGDNPAAILILGGTFMFTSVMLFIYYRRKTKKKIKKETHAKKIDTTIIVRELFKSFLAGFLFLFVVVGVIMGKMDWLAPPPSSHSDRFLWVFGFLLVCIFIGLLTFKLPLFYLKKRSSKRNVGLHEK
jgi:glycerol uptake facilitator-like aquaporin